MAAATISAILEGPAQRTYLSVAEAKSTQRTPLRGFTTLSASLGSMAVALHTGLLHAARHEGSPAVLAVALRSLCVLLRAAPYERLPPQLLADALAVVSPRLWPQSQQQQQQDAAPAAPKATAAEWQQVQTAATACIAEALSTKQASPAVQRYLNDLSNAPQPQLGLTVNDPTDSMKPVQGHGNSVGLGQGATAAVAAVDASAARAAAAACGFINTAEPSQANPPASPATAGTPDQQQLPAAAARPLAMPPLAQQVLQLAYDGDAVLRIEALAALKGLLTNYASAMLGTYPVPYVACFFPLD